ncbi:MAG: hypothetical protein LC104_16100 [Bacteroidales bacterium]|nr:hypothetical protein [Bacteroidales bacterium]
MRSARLRTRTNRPAAILLIVLTMLALFAVIGLVFVNYSQSQATSAQVRRSSVSTTTESASYGGLSGGAGYPGDPSDMINTALRYLIYPGNDTGDDLLVGARGYDMARMVYGYKAGDLNCVAYNGLGLFHEIFPSSQDGVGDRAQVINYRYFNNGDTVFDPEHTNYRTGAAISTSPGTTYIGRNAAYTAADRNNAYVALTDPETGIVIAPSFHRPALFGSLDQSNANWTSDAGKYMLIRPRPFDQMSPTQKTAAGGTPTSVANYVAGQNIFQYPPPNADGTVTGDVQNLRYADGQTRNDSVWVDFNLPVFNYQGKKVKALVAPLILPLDGRVNLLANGNIRLNGGHASHEGFGPWEIDLSQIVGAADAAALIANRYGSTNVPMPRGSTAVTTLNFGDLQDVGAYRGLLRPIASAAYPNTVPGVASRVDFDAAFTAPSSGAAPWVLPTQLQSDPTWPSAAGNGWYDNGNAVETTLHPGLYNPYQWDQNAPTAPANARAFPYKDLRILAGRYSDIARVYGDPYLGQTFANTFGKDAGSGPNSAADLRRALTTTISNSLARPGLAPNVFGAPTGTYQYDPARQFPVLTTAPTFNASAVSPGVPGTTDHNGTMLRNVRAALGAVDLNRPLVDYRDPATQPMNPTDPWPLSATSVQVASYNAAQMDRQRFAMDIFARLVIATGASANVTMTAGIAAGMPVVTPAVAPTDPEFAALRWLAQLSANIVDYIDSDDVNTTFVWWPANPSNPLDPIVFSDPAQVKQRVVYGVEKPRLVLNEVYAEVTNDPADDMATNGATKPFRVRFFIEALNPSSRNMTTSERVPLGVFDTTSGQFVENAVPLKVGTNGVYQFEIYHNAANVLNDLQQLDNVDGSITSPSVKPILSPNLGSGTLATPPNADFVGPNNGSFQPTTDRAGFAVFGPTINTPQVSTAFAPDTTAAPFSFMVQVPNATDPTMVTMPADAPPAPPASPLPYLEYYIDQSSVTANGDVKTKILDKLNASRHVVVMRRLACPYLPPSPTNPYITVDYMGQIKVQDAVKFVADDGNAMTPPEMARTPSPTDAWSIGRAQPYAGFQGNAAGIAEDLTRDLDPSGMSAPTLLNTLTLAQKPAGGMAQQQTLFRHNAADGTGMTLSDSQFITPFEWLVHLDRKLINAVELLHVPTVAPHRLTHDFARPNPDGGPRPYFHRHDLQHQGIGSVNPLPTGPLFDPQSPLYRMFEVLTVKPWTYGVPNGGRVPGKININMIWDQGGTSGSRVFDALMLTNGGMSPANQFTPPEVQAIWNGLKASRSPSFIPPGNQHTWAGNTLHEAGAGDQPIQSFGTPMLMAGGSFPQGSGIANTLFRNRLDTTGTYSVPLFSRDNNPAAPTMHPYQAYEPMRKVFNNITTTTDCYLVILTVGWFEVTNVSASYSVANPPLLGTEIYRTVPGDMRTQAVAVIDRTQIGVDNGGNQVGGVYFSELAAEVPLGGTTLDFPANGPGGSGGAVIYSEGKTFIININNGTQLRLGTGDAATGQGDGEWVTVSGVTYNAATGMATVGISGTTCYHPAGSPVSNAFLRNPGPQPGFDYTKPQWQGVVPFVAELRPSQ